MLLNIEKSGEQDKEHSYVWLLDTVPGFSHCFRVRKDTGLFGQRLTPPNDTVFAQSKFRSIMGEDRINVTQKSKFVFGGMEILSEKEKMIVTHIFSFSDKKVCFSGSVKVGIVR